MIRGSSCTDGCGVMGLVLVGEGVSFNADTGEDDCRALCFLGFLSRFLATSCACRLICAYDSPPALLLDSDLESAVLLTKRKLFGAGMLYVVAQDVSVHREHGRAIRTDV